MISCGGAYLLNDDFFGCVDLALGTVDFFPRSVTVMTKTIRRSGSSANRNSYPVTLLTQRKSVQSEQLFLQCC